MFIKIKKILKSYTKKQEDKKENKEFLKIKMWWEKTMGEETTKNTKIYDFNKKELIIKTSGPAWRNELNLTKEQIKKN